MDLTRLLECDDGFGYGVQLRERGATSAGGAPLPPPRPIAGVGLQKGTQAEEDADDGEAESIEFACPTCGAPLTVTGSGRVAPNEMSVSD